MSFARNFEAGMRLAGDALDTYDSVRQKRDLRDVMAAKAEGLSGYTQADGQQLEAIANAKDADGNAAYQLDARPDGSYGIKVRGADGSYADVGGAGIQQQRVTDFMGQRHAGELNQDNQDALRYRAAADIIGRSDPIRGLQMRRDIKRDERENEEFGWKRQRQPLEQRAAELQLSEGERKERQGLRDDEWQSKIGDAYKEWDELGSDGQSKLLRSLSYNPNVKGHMVLNDKGGATVLTEKGSPFTLSQSELRHMYALEKMMAVDPVRANKELASSSEKVRQIAKDVFDMDVKTQELGIRRDTLGETTRHNRAIEGIQSAEAGAKSAYYNRATKDLREYVNAKGESVLVDVANLPRGQDGTVALPPNLRPKSARPEVSTANMVDYAKALVEANTPDPDAPSKPLTLDKAMGVARAQLTEGGYKSAADRLVEAYMAKRGNGQPEPKATKPPAIGLKVPPQITTITPPRTGADLVPRKPMSDEELIFMLGR